MERVVQWKLGQMPERCFSGLRRAPPLGVAALARCEYGDLFDAVYVLDRHSFPFVRLRRRPMPMCYRIAALGLPLRTGGDLAIVVEGGRRKCGDNLFQSCLK